MRCFLTLMFVIFLFHSIFSQQNTRTSNSVQVAIASSISNEATPDSVLSFMENLRALCGMAFEGKIIQAPEGDTTFAGKRLIMEVRHCADNQIAIPFHVGDNRSRTWVLTIQGDRLLLKHDHRKQDGSEDQLTQYGGLSTNPGLSSRQTFPADFESYQMKPEAASNVWMIEVVPGKTYTYMVHRLGTGRMFQIEFDLTKPVKNPPAPWGWD